MKISTGAKLSVKNLVKVWESRICDSSSRATKKPIRKSVKNKRLPRPKDPGPVDLTDFYNFMAKFEPIQICRCWITERQRMYPMMRPTTYMNRKFDSRHYWSICPVHGRVGNENHGNTAFMLSAMHAKKLERERLALIK
ncbi:hypothetical protein M153_4090006385 [Pseudoloma neurophilia]|uniref:Uncharacterized protein n=1 Tax=Pseudoloma neurophilia TaxID=146866 RepID=A0A0R0LXJ7_9MICR|nr:hypothetical protein M153_4090006385 [Pseudoloma neurophilia]